MHSRSLIRIFTERSLDSQGCSVSSCGQRRLIRLTVRPDLRLCWAHMYEGTFSDVEVHIASRCGSYGYAEAYIVSAFYIQPGTFISLSNVTLCFRLSKVMSSQLMDSNPNIADLSDTNRPTKLVEQFSELYDNEWTNAYGVLRNRLADEFPVIRFLLELLQVPKTIEPRAKKGSLSFPSNQSFIAHARSLSKAAYLVLWLKFPLGLSEQQWFW